MAGKPYDATARELFELDPAAWLKYLHIPVIGSARVEIIDSDVSTVTAEADKVLRVDSDPPWIVHVEFQAARDSRMAERIHRYHALLGYRHEALVRSTLVLLRPLAEGPESYGIYERRFPGEDAHLIFRYDVVRAWEQPAEDLLTGSLATLPLLAVSDFSGVGIVEALAAMAERLRKEANPGERAMLLAATRVLMGLSHNSNEADQILRRLEMLDVLKIHGIEESSTYQAIFQKGEAKGKAEGKAEGEARGRAEEARAILLRLGNKKFGKPEPRILEPISQITDHGRLEALADRILEAKSWDDLLATSAEARHGGA